MQYYNPSSNVEIYNTYGRESYQVWGYSNAAASFVTYDNLLTVSQKAHFAKLCGLAGVMFWSIDGDSANPDISLIKTAKKTLNS